MRDTLILDALPENFEQVQAFVDGYLERLDCPMKTQMQIDVALEEAFVNVAHYAYGEKTGRARLDLEADEATGELCLTLIDSGKPFDPLAREDPDLSLPAEQREAGGLGIRMVKKLLDEVRYAYEDGQNVLTMRKRVRG